MGRTSVRQNDIKDYWFNDLDDWTTNITYVWYTKTDWTWLIKKMDETSWIVMKYANIGNNSWQATYNDAWTNRATLTYNYFNWITLW